MLVLLIIFMVTAPLLNLGVDIELPQSNAKPVEQMKDPVVIVVDADGNYFLTLEGVPKESISAENLVVKVSAFVRNNPQVPVLVAGDQQVGYGAVYQVMVLLQQAGRSEEHTSELQSLMRISYAVFCLKKKRQEKI